MYNEKKELLNTYKTSVDDGIEASITINATEGEETILENEKTYYCKLYIKDNNQNKVYLYDLDKKTDEVEYEIRLLDSVEISDIKAEFIKNQNNGGEIFITHKASVDSGFFGFKYRISTAEGEEVIGEVNYKTNKISESQDNGTFVLKLEDYGDKEKEYQVIIDAKRGTFFEYNTKYIIEITPIIQEGNEETNYSKTLEYIYNPQKPELVLYAKRIEAVDQERDASIEWSISVSDKDYLITEEGIYYEIYRNGDEKPIAEKSKVILNINNYATITLNNKSNPNKENHIVDDKFGIENEYTLKVYYKRYTSNKEDVAPTEETKTKKILKIENGISIGDVSWKFEEGKKIKLKFYNSYGIGAINKIQYTIYDTNGQTAINLQNVSNVTIDTSDGISDEIHKIITFNIDKTNMNEDFIDSKAYKIIIYFYNEADELIAKFEPENPETYNKGE